VKWFGAVVFWRRGTALIAYTRIRAAKKGEHEGEMSSLNNRENKKDRQSEHECGKKGVRQAQGTEYVIMAGHKES
jgi:hypothetical protein